MRKDSDTGNDRRTPFDFLRGVIAMLRQPENFPTKKPDVAVDVLKIFEEAGPNGISIKDLTLKLYNKDTPTNRKLAAAKVVQLNSRYLNEAGIEIEGIRTYRVEPIEPDK